MRRFSMISAMLCLLAVNAVACTFVTTHNYYLFHTFEQGGRRPAAASTDDFWRKYVGSSDESFSYLSNLDDIVAKARQKNDSEVLEYIQTLNSYLKASEIGFDGWEYPSKEQLAFRTMTINNTLSKAKQYKGTRLRQHYMLLVMRANMQLKRYQENISYWTATASKLTASPHRTWMRSLYANALCNTGAPAAAADIYTELGDEESVTWCVRKYRNVAGIRSIYEKAPAASVLNYLVQDFVNNAQETMDNYSEEYSSATRATSTEEDVEWIHMLGAEPVFLDEVRQFIAFANMVAQEGRTPYPCMWKSAAGALHFLLGERGEAARELSEAMNLSGTQLMKDNARAISIVVAASQLAADDGGNELVQGLDWLKQKAKTDEHYAHVLDRLLYNVLPQHFTRSGQANRATAMIGMADEMERQQGGNFSHVPIRDEWSWNQDYSGEYAVALDSLSADQLVAYMKYLTGKPATALDRYVQANIYRDADYFNDRIGTRYLAEGQFSKAIPYLKKVPLSFLEMQNISYRMAHHDFAVERWFNHQTAGDNDGAYKAAPASNQKLAFCQRVLALQKIVDGKKGNTAEGLQAAYELATAYFQASYWGDSWYLTRYGHSVSDEREEGEFDFIGQAIALLEKSAQSSDSNLRGKSLYALGFIPDEPWCNVEWSWDDAANSSYERYILHPSARQYRALASLSNFARQQHTFIDSYVSKCDVLKTFRRETRS